MLVNGTSSRSTRPSGRRTASRSTPSSTYTKATRPPSRKATQDCPNTHGGNPMSRPRSTAPSVPLPSVQRYRLQNPVRSLLYHSEPSGAHAASQIDSRDGEPATTVRRPSRSTTNRVASHGMSGWSHSSQHTAPPSGLHRGPATKSGPLTSTSGADGRSASRRTIVFTASPPSAGCSSCTHSNMEPSGETSPSAYRSARGESGSGVRATGAPPGPTRCTRCVAQSTNHSTPWSTHHSPPPYSCTALRAFHGGGAPR